MASSHGGRTTVDRSKGFVTPYQRPSCAGCGPIRAKETRSKSGSGRPQVGRRDDSRGRFRQVTSLAGISGECRSMADSGYRPMRCNKFVICEWFLEATNRASYRSTVPRPTTEDVTRARDSCAAFQRSARQSHGVTMGTDSRPVLSIAQMQSISVLPRKFSVARSAKASL